MKKKKKKLKQQQTITLDLNLTDHCTCSESKGALVQVRTAKHDLLNETALTQTVPACPYISSGGCAALASHFSSPLVFHLEER